MAYINYSKLLFFGAIGSICITFVAKKYSHANTIIVLAGDLGNGDLSYIKGKTSTPNIDRIFKEGVRFFNFRMDVEESEYSFIYDQNKWLETNDNRQRWRKNIEALFDLKNDPYEMNNLLGSNPDRFKYKETVEELRGKLTGYLHKVNSPLESGVAIRILILD